MENGTGLFMVHQTIGRILCCKCGVQMQPNAANMCAKCLCSEVDVTENIPKHLSITHCPECNSYLSQQKTWVRAQLESSELKALCLKKLNKPDEIRLVGAEFVWTEPHSRRIKIRINVQREVLNGVIVEKSCIIEYVQHEQMCGSCTRLQSNPDQWVAVVQLRQHVSHRRTLFYMEQLILKHDAASRAINIKQTSHGIDFFFANRSHAVKFVDFLGKIAPVRSFHDKQLVSHDKKSNIVNNKYSFSVEIAPICREDLICLPPKVYVGLGNIGPLVICSKVTNNITLLDPLSLRQCFLDSDQYWRTSFKPLLSSRQLVEYVVLDMDYVRPSTHNSGPVLADAQIARVSDFGKNDITFFVRTHLGHVLKPGDHALGYDLHCANTNDYGLDEYKNVHIPEVILIKKSYEEKWRRRRGKSRPWKLKSLNMDVDNPKNRVDEEKISDEYEEFLRDLEENPEMRFNISLYRDREYQSSEMASMTDEELPSVPLTELISDLNLGNGNDADMACDHP